MIECMNFRCLVALTLSSALFCVESDAGVFSDMPKKCLNKISHEATYSAISEKKS